MKIAVRGKNGDPKKVEISIEGIEQGDVVTIPDFVAFKLSALIDKAGKHGDLTGYVTYVEGKWRCYEEHIMTERGYTPVGVHDKAFEPKIRR